MNRREELRRAAAQIEQARPGWSVIYGPWRRRFIAWACWLPDRCPVIEAADEDELLRHMQLVEIEHPYPQTRPRAHTFPPGSSPL
jgi:hypothetical protein